MVSSSRIDLALERARNLDIVIFDKTERSHAVPALSGVVAAPGGNESDLLASCCCRRSQLRTPAR